MIALYIILGVLAAIILLIVILLHFSVKAYIEADNKHFRLEVKYLGFTVFKLRVPDKDKPSEDDSPKENLPQSEPIPEYELSEIPEADSTERDEEEQKEGESEETDSKNDSEEAKNSEADDEDENTSNDEEPSLLDKFNVVKKYIPAGKKAFRKLLKLIRFYDFTFEMTYGSDDPYKAGLNFGRINALFYNVLALLCCVFSVKIDHTDIKCDFEHKAADFYFKTAVYVRPSALISLAVYVGIYYLIIRSKLKKLENKSKKENKHE